MGKVSFERKETQTTNQINILHSIIKKLPSEKARGSDKITVEQFKKVFSKHVSKRPIFPKHGN